MIWQDTFERANAGGRVKVGQIGFCGEIDSSTIPGSGIPLDALTVRQYVGL